MEIVFEIKENVENILNECKSSNYWNYSEGVNGKVFILEDKEFSNSYASCFISQEKQLDFKTAWSSFTYKVYEKDGKTLCRYEGALKGFLQQALMPRLTPKGNIYEVLIYSTEGGWMKFRQYLDKRNWNLYFDIED